MTAKGGRPVASKQKSGSDALWMTRKHCAVVLGIAPTAFDVNIAIRIPGEYRKVENNSNHYYLPAVVKAWSEWKSTKDKKSDPDSGEESHLNAKRRMETEKMQIEIEMLRGTLVSVQDWESRMSGRFWDILRQHGKTVKRTFGNDGVIYFNDLLAEIERAMTERNGAT